MRPSKTAYYMDIAKAIAARSTCLRRKYGAVIVKDDAIVSSGYNGSPRGTENCCDQGVCKRKELGCEHGEHYEWCESVHGEANAVINAARHGVSVLGGTLYLYGEDADTGEIVDAIPCMMCERVIKNAGIVNVIGSKAVRK